MGESGQMDRKQIATYLLIAVLFVLAFLLIYAALQVYGPQWDVIVRYLQGKTLVNFLTHNVSAQAAFSSGFSNNLLYYFEPYREPLSIPIFALLTLFFQNSILVYMLVTLALYAFAFYKLSKELKIDPLLAFSVFLNVYLIMFLFLANGGEGLSVAMALIGFIYLLRKDSKSGLFFGLAGLAKYPSIITFPLVFFLGNKKKIVKALSLEVLTVFIWGVVFDYLVYGSLFYSYVLSLTSSNVLSSASTIYMSADISIVFYPMLFGAIGLVVFALKKLKPKIVLSYKTKIFAAFIVLTAVVFIVLAQHNDQYTQARYGYLLSIALLIPALWVLNLASQKVRYLRYMVAALSATMLLTATIYGVYGADTSALQYNQPGNGNTIFSHAGAELTSLGFSGCRYMSNAWVPMLYSSYNTYAPFIEYYTMPPSNYSLQQEQYPIVVFKYGGVPSSYIVNLNSSKLVYNDSNISIYLPQNVKCYTN
jgi:hypothetical protein